jgi:hypothetical protein
MKTKVVLTALLLYLALTTQKGFGIFLSGDNTLVSQTKQAVLIIAGKVSDIQYVYRDDIYTDVTITVSKTLKGQPNIDKNTVRFRIEGGVWGNTLSEISTVPKFKVGQELILFLEKRTWGTGWSFYDGLYPLVYPPYPKINTLKENGKEYTVAHFYLAFFKEEYLLKLPLDVAFRLIENAVKAPEEVALLEEKIRPIKDIWKPENRRKQQVESPEFLLMLESELTKIETKIKEKESRIEQ